MFTDEEKEQLRSMTITVRDMQRTGYCVGTGIMPWLRAHGMDAKDVLRNGINGHTLLERGDALSHKVLRRVLDGR